MALEPVNEAQILFDEGLAAVDDERWEDAVEAFSRAIEFDREFLDAYIEKGYALLELEEDEQASATFRQALQLDPDAPEALMGLGEVSWHLGDREQAMSVLQRAAEIQPDNPGAWALLGMVHAAGGDQAQAVAVYDRALTLDTDDPILHYQRAVSLGLLNRFDDMEVGLQRAISLQPNLVDAYIPLAMLRGMQGRNQDAFNLLQKALQYDPNFAEAHLRLGELYLFEQDTAAARQEYDVLRTLDPEMAAQLGHSLGVSPASDEAPRAARAPSEPAPIYQLKVTLLGSSPPIWRRLLVPGDTKLGKLHRILQASLGWKNSHTHQFETNGAIYSDPVFEFDDTKNEKRVTLEQIAPDEETELLYTYDMGDNWEHEIQIERIFPPEEGVTYPVCIAGEQAGPPDDVGGIYGYYEFLDAVRDPKHPEHREMLEWIGGRFDPNAVDLKAINTALAKIK